MPKDAKVQKERILRFGQVARMAHWAHTATFFLLALTGMIIYIKSFTFLAPLFGGIQGARIVHRVAAVGFIIFPLIALFAKFNGFKEWMTDVTSWSKSDIGFLSNFPKEFFGAHVESPPQGRFNGGEKINSLLQVFGCTLLGLSGLVIWGKESLPIGLVQIALPIHDVAFVLTFTASLGHMYLALVLPSSKHAINGMLSGYVDGEYAKSHYPLWYKKAKKDKA